MTWVIIVAPHDDLHAEIVAARVRKRGGRALILPLDEFLVSWRIAFSVTKNRFSYVIHTDGLAIDDRDISGLWWRRPRMARTGQASEHHAFVRRETAALIDGLLLSLGSRVVNPLEAERSARNKLRQLEAAAAVGFRVPDTLVTTDIDSAIEFREVNHQGTIFKLLTFAPGRKLIETRLFTEDADAYIESLSLAPVLFQENIVKRAEVRATIIDDKCFAVECVTASPSLDWRTDPMLEYRRFDLSSEIEDMLLRLHRRLGLRYGAVDLAVTADGQYVFFETNVAGQFLFGEIDAGEPISEAMADALLGEASPAPDVRRQTSIGTAVAHRGQTSLGDSSLHSARPNAADRTAGDEVFLDGARVGDVV